MQFSSRRTVRVYSFILCGILLLAASIGVHMHLTRRLQTGELALRRTVLARMNEENERLTAALDAADRDAVRQAAALLCGYASMAYICPAETPEEAMLLSGIADTALFYDALSRAVSDEAALSDTDFWKQCTASVSDGIAAMALALTDRTDHFEPGDAERAAAAQLSALTSSFRTDPLRRPTLTHPGYQFDREPPLTQAQARDKLRTLIGAPASFLGNCCADDAHGCYVFSCQNGYAEVSRCGGHLLSYAFYPRPTAHDGRNADACINDADLETIAATFLKKAGIAASVLTAEEDRHGIRCFQAEPEEGRAVTVGIRMHDGTAVFYRAEDYYLRDSK